jgi:transposase
MKFKTQKKQNQLIERITVKHLIVGIDIAQENHVARAVNYRGIVLGEPLSFPNNDDGFNCLQQWIRHLQALALSSFLRHLYNSNNILNTI